MPPKLRHFFDIVHPRKQKPLKFSRKIRGLSASNWWSRGDLNPRPPALRYWFYMLSQIY